MKRLAVTKSRKRGRPVPRIRIGARPIIWFVVLAILTAVAGTWINRQYEASEILPQKPENSTIH